MKIEQMETVLAEYVKKRSAAIGQPITQEIHLVRNEDGIRVSDSAVEVSLYLILEGVSLEDLVDRIVSLDWELLHQARKEKKRIIEREKQLATPHIHELERLCTTEEFNSFIKSFIKGAVCKKEKGD